MKIIFRFSVIIFLLFLPLNVYGKTGGGNGDGTGSSHNKPMVHYTITVGGRADMAPDSDMIIAFTTNVVNLRVKDNNLACFKLYDNNDNPIEIDVIMGDDQVDRSIRHLVTIDPKDDLIPGENYYILVDKSLQSKNGEEMESEVKIDYSVGEGKGTGDAQADIMDLTPESTIDLNGPPKKSGAYPVGVAIITVLAAAVYTSFRKKKG